MDTKEEELFTSLDDTENQETDTKSSDIITEISATEVYNKLQRFGYYRCFGTKYIDLRDSQEFNECHIATSVNVSVKTEPIHSFNDLCVIDTIQTCKLKNQLTAETMIVFIANNNNKYTKSVQCFLNSKYKIKTFMGLSLDGLNEFCVKYPWVMRHGKGYKNKNEILQSYPHEIIENKLFLGNYEQSDNAEVISNLNITHIMNVTKETHLNKFENVKYYKVPIDDDAKENILENDLLINAIKHIESVLNESDKNRIFVHCHQGVSRSSTFVIGYLMYDKQWKFAQALEFVKEMRPRIYPNIGFRRQLIKFENELK